MKLLRVIVILLIGLLMLPAPSVEAARPKRKKAKTTAVKKKSGRKKSKARVTKSSRGRTSTARRKGRTRVLSREEYEARRAELREQDSIRLRIGGTRPLDMGQNVLQVANIEPLTRRFSNADTTLTRKEIESLYFTRRVAEGDSIFFGQILPKVDTAIAKGHYADALRTAEKGLLRNPMHIGLLKRACDLAEHEDSPRLDGYVWRISELFYLIQHTGDGKSPATALRVMEVDDAILYEVLWLDTIQERIMERAISPSSKGQLLTLSIRDPKGKIYKKYYRIG